MTPDVNVLIGTSRSDHPYHTTAFAILDQALAACAYGASLKLMPMVVASFLRLVTNPKIFVQPTPVADALGFVAALVAVPGVEMPSLRALVDFLDPGPYREPCTGKIATIFGTRAATRWRRSASFFMFRTNDPIALIKSSTRELIPITTRFLSIAGS